MVRKNVSECSSASDCRIVSDHEIDCDLAAKLDEHAEAVFENMLTREDAMWNGVDNASPQNRDDFIPLDGRIGLPKVISTQLDSNVADRMHGFILTPFRYDSQDKIVEMGKKIIIDQANVMNTSLTMRFDYRSRLISDILHGGPYFANVDDAMRLVSEYSPVFVPLSNGDFTTQGKNDDAPQCQLSDKVEFMEQSVSRLQDLDAVGLPAGSSNVYDAQNSSKEILPNAVQATIATGSESVEAQSVDVGAVRINQRSWVEVVDEDSRAVQKDVSSIDREITDYMFHAVAYESTRSLAYSDALFMIVKRVFTCDHENVPQNEAGALIGSATFFSLMNDSQYTVYVVVSKPKAKGNHQGNGGYQLGIIVQQQVALDVFKFSFPRALINIFMLLEKGELALRQEPVRFFSREFGSFHLMAGSKDDNLDIQFRKLKREFIGSKNLDVFSFGMKLLDIVIDQMKSVGHYNIEHNTGPTLQQIGSYASVREGLTCFQSLVNNLIESESDKYCITRMRGLIFSRDGLIYGSKIMKKIRLFETPCGDQLDNFKAYAMHKCAIRFKALGIATRHDLLLNGIYTSRMKGFFCSECYRIYYSKADAILCNYFCLIASNMVILPSGLRRKDAYGRVINEAH